MATHCAKHQFEQAEAQCRECGNYFCNECLVYTFGPSKPPFCVPCALIAAGIRRRSATDRREDRARRRAFGRGAALDSAPADSPLGDPDVLGGFASDLTERGRRSAFGRGRVGMLAVAAVLAAVAVPVLSHFA